MQTYSDSSRERNPNTLPNVEVFYINELDAGAMSNGISELFTAGYYYWFCFPGCLPDSQPIGPFSTEEDAIKDAQRNE